MESVAKRRSASALAWSICALTLAVVTCAVVIDRLGGMALQGFGLFFVGTIAMFLLMGALIASRHPENPIGWIYCVVGVSFALAALASAWSDYAVVKDPGALPFGPFMAWLGVWMWSPAIALLFTFAFLLFPDGHLPSRRWRPTRCRRRSAPAAPASPQGCRPGGAGRPRGAPREAACPARRCGAC